MNRPTDDFEPHGQLIAALLSHGTWLASAMIAAGLTLGLLDRPALLHGLAGYDVAKAGIVLFIVLPIIRVALMLAVFLRERDYAYVAISALVLAIIGGGFLVGL